MSIFLLTPPHWVWYYAINLFVKSRTALYLS